MLNQGIKGATLQKKALRTTHQFKLENPLPLFGEALAKLVGVAPLNRDSGQTRGHRTTWGGRAPVEKI